MSAMPTQYSFNSIIAASQKNRNRTACDVSPASKEIIIISRPNIIIIISSSSSHHGEEIKTNANSHSVETRDCNPGLLFQSRDFGIEKCQSRDPGIESRDWVPDFELVKISSNSLVLVSWWVLESWILIYLLESYFDIMWIIVHIFTFLVSCRMIQFHHYLMESGIY